MNGMARRDLEAAHPRDGALGLSRERLVAHAPSAVTTVRPAFRTSPAVRRAEAEVFRRRSGPGVVQTLILTARRG